MSGSCCKEEKDEEGGALESGSRADENHEQDMQAITMESDNLKYGAS